MVTLKEDEDDAAWFVLLRKLCGRFIDVEKDDNWDDDDGYEGDGLLDEGECFEDEFEDSDDDEVTDTLQDEEKEPEPTLSSFGYDMLQLWKKRRPQLMHDYAIVGWLLSPFKEIQEQVAQKITPRHKERANKLLKRFFVPEGLGLAEENNEYMTIVGSFWLEWGDFNSRTNFYSADQPCWHASQLHNHTKVHVWHKAWTYRHGFYLGKLACRVTSKILGIGNAERNWGAVKHLKSGQRSHLSSEAVSKQATLFGKSCADKANKKEPPSVKVTCLWQEIDLDLFAKNFEDSNPNEVSQGLLGSALQPAAKRGIIVGKKKAIKLFTEDWEEEAIRKQDIESIAKLQRKYGGVFFEEGENIFMIHPKFLHWLKEHGKSRYQVIGMALNKEFDPDEKVKPTPEQLFDIDSDLHGLIYEYYHKRKRDPFVEMLLRDEHITTDNKWNNWMPTPDGKNYNDPTTSKAYAKQQGKKRNDKPAPKGSNKKHKK